MEWFFSFSLRIQILIIYLVLTNIITFLFFGLDKIKSRFDHRRVRERTLWILVLLGGSVGGFFGMDYFRHKTKKWNFMLGIPMIFLVQLGLIILSSDFLL